MKAGGGGEEGAARPLAGSGGGDASPPPGRRDASRVGCCRLRTSPWPRRPFSPHPQVKRSPPTVQAAEWLKPQETDDTRRGGRPDRGVGTLVERPWGGASTSGVGVAAAAAAVGRPSWHASLVGTKGENAPVSEEDEAVAPAAAHGDAPCARVGEGVDFCGQRDSALCGDGQATRGALTPRVDGPEGGEGKGVGVAEGDGGD